MKHIAVLALILCASVAHAADIEVNQCNTKDGDVFVPELTVKIEGKTHTLRVGDRGLSKGIMHSGERIRKFIRAAFSIDENLSIGVTFPCASSSDGVPPPPPPDVEDPEPCRYCETQV